jgi:hypothetical protein
MKNTIQKKVQVSLIGMIILVLACYGCAQLGKQSKYRQAAGPEQASLAEAKPTTSVFVHTVRWPRETLSIIAKWYTGELENWKALVKANPKLKPNRIYIGNKILIPGDLLKTRKPMPRKFLAEFT